VCCQLSSTDVDTKGMINWIGIGLVSWQCLERCVASLSLWSSTSVYSTMPSQTGVGVNSWLVLIVKRTHTQPFNGLWSAGTRRNTHPLTPILIVGHPLSTSSIYCDPLHPLYSVCMLDSPFWQPLSRSSLIFHLVLALYNLKPATVCHWLPEVDC